MAVGKNLAKIGHNPEQLKRGGGVRGSGSDVVTAARDWDYKPWITQAKHTKTQIHGWILPGPAFTQFVLKPPVFRGSAYHPFMSLSCYTR